MEVAQRKSRNREVIYEVLASTKSHPDAEWVFNEAKKVCADLGIATVYRNLKTLVESGKIVAIESVDGTVHYDACVLPHSHFVCEECGEISDIDIPFVSLDGVKSEGFIVKRGKIVLYGKCPKCSAIS